MATSLLLALILGLEIGNNVPSERQFLFPNDAWRMFKNDLYKTYEFPPGSNSTMTLDNETTVAVARGSLQWPIPGQHTADMAVLPGLVSSKEVAALRSLLPETFDRDADTVDDEETFEFYLEKNGDYDKSIRGMTGKPDRHPGVYEQRLPARESIAALVRPIMRTRIVPFVNREFPDCGGTCQVCYSFVRRYLPEERTTHDLHFDINALVTMVVSLGSHGRDFTGGLFVSTGGTRHVLALQAGDAVAHQSNLLHGVDVLSGARWSWVMWFKNDGDCDGDPAQWQRESAEAGDPVAMFLTARRLKVKGGVDTSAEKRRWLKQASDLGFVRATNELGMMYKEEATPHSLRTAKQLFTLAATASQPSADAMYNLALMKLHDGSPMAEAVDLFSHAAALGSKLAMFNLGVALVKGFPELGLERDLTTARQWFELNGSADAIYAIAKTWLQEQGDRQHNWQQYLHWLWRAAQKGNPTAQQRVQRMMKQRQKKEL